MYVIPAICALLGAVFLAFGSERQAAGVRSGPAGEEGSGLSGMLALLRSPVWLFGGALMLIGICLNVAALARAPLSVVQPIGALAVAITTVIHARRTGLRIDPRTWAAVAACMAGSVAFVLITLTATRDDAVPTRAQEGITVRIAWIVVGACVLAALAVKRRPSALVPIMAAGVLYGCVAVGVRLTAVRLVGGRPLLWIVVAALAAAALLGVWFVQTAYRYGPPDLVVAGLTVIDPMVGVLIGILVLGELRPGLPVWVPLGLVVAAVVATVGIAQLSRAHPDVVERREARRGAEPSLTESPEEAHP